VGRRGGDSAWRRKWCVVHGYSLTAIVEPACSMRSVAYGRFIAALQEARVELNRKMLSEIAIHSPEDFDAIVEAVKEHLPKKNKEAA
jgi:ribosomal protein L20